MKKLQLVCIALLFLLLTSCGVLNQVPPDQAIRLAIAQQQTNIRQDISNGLGLSAQSDSALKFKIDRLNVASRQKLADTMLSKSSDLDSLYLDSLYKVRGTFDATLANSAQTVRQESPFEIYLATNSQRNSQRNSQSEKAENPGVDKVETWYLVPPDRLNRQ